MNLAGVSYPEHYICMVWVETSGGGSGGGDGGWW